MLFNSPKKNYKSHIFSQEQYYFTESELSKLLLQKINPEVINLINKTTPINRKTTSTEKQALFDLDNYLINDLLVKVDRASMYSSLEVKVPILDHRIIEYTLNLSNKLKIHKGTQKYILKEVLYEYIPKSLMERPKWGFGFL